MAKKSEARREAQTEKDDFVPKGAIAFMALMLLAYGAIWFLFYLLMVGRP